MRLHVDGGEDIVVGEILDSLLTRLLPLVVPDDDKGEGVIAHIAGERDVSNMTVGIKRIVKEGIESGHGQVESWGVTKSLMREL
jgi:hypothetical protein